MLGSLNICEVGAEKEEIIWDAFNTLRQSSAAIPVWIKTGIEVHVRVLNKSQSVLAGNTLHIECFQFLLQDVF